MTLWNRPSILASCLLGLMSLSSWASYYDTLPQGVRTLAYRQVFVNNAQGSYGSSGDYRDYGFKVNFNAELLENVNDFSKYYFGELKKISPEAYDDFSFGEYVSDIKAKGDVKALGFGYGITPRLTVYGFLPIYSVKVNVLFNRTKGNNHEAVLASVEQNNKSNSFDSAVVQGITENLPDGSGETLQSVLVNYFGYEPMGTWEGRGLGDAEVGAMYRLTDWDYGGLLMSAGAMAPSGRKDNPDMLQDVAFGEGHWSFFSEFGGGFKPTEALSLDSWTRYTYKLSYDDNIRLPEDADFPLTKRKAMTSIKPGDKWEWNARVSVSPTKTLTLSGTYIYEKVFKAKYKSVFADANKILEDKSASEGQSVRASLGISSIDAFLSKKFFAPMMTEIAWQKLFSGKNRDKYDRIDLELKVLF